MNNQLSNISTQYRKFSKGQYIEHAQFNEFLDFFEDQDRLSRVMLQGVGIVCGLKPSLIYKSKVLSGIQLSQGVALTTDGDLLTLNNTSEISQDLYVSDLKTVNIESKNYTHFKVYDNFKAKYPSFYGGRDQIELWELATAQEANSDFQSIDNLPDLENKYLLLYLESYEKEVKPCRGVDCDNHGIQQIRNLKVLVTSTGGINHILERDKVQPHPLFIKDILKPVQQERVITERLILEKGIEAQFSSSDLKEMYVTVLEKDDYGKLLFQKINAISQIMGTPSVDHESFKKILEDYLAKDERFQYVYDVVKDLTDTYSEIIKVLPSAFTKYLPDFVSFPKHVMLGKLISDTQLDSSRHQFYNSPVLDDEKATQRVVLLINRFIQQVQNFKYPSLENEPQIKITPSQKLNPLGNKAVPFYYQTTEEFLKAWNFDKTGNRSSGDNLGYGINFFTPNTNIQDDSLNYNIDKNSFYSIEGHQGMSSEEAFNQIRQIRDQQQLGFDIMVLSFGELKNNKDLFKAYFNEYVEKHPGLEHKRGVERGGTFVMVYTAKGRGTTVIADFSLPYICCTPKTDVKLSLPSNVICAEAARIPFTVIPVNGEVIANVGAGVEIDGGQYFFNPKLVDPSLHGQEITFTVNGKPTNCSIKVIAQPEVKVVVDHIFYPEGGAIGTTVNMVVSGENFKDYTYSWDFWDNGSFITLKPDEKGNVDYTFYNLIPTRIPAIKVKVSGSGCTQDIAIRDWYDAPEVPETVIKSITFPAGGDCCHQVNKAPVAVARASQTTIQLPVDAVDLIGEFSSDPDGNIDSFSWSQVSPLPSTVTIVNPFDKDTKVMGLVEGVYVFRLKVTDAYGEIDTDDVTITVVKEDDRVPSLTEVSYKMTGTETIQVFKVGPNVSAGNKFWVKVYQVQLTVLATSSDTPTTIAIKLADLINNTSEAQWKQFQTEIANPFPPKASASGVEVTIHLDTRNSFVGDASMS